MGLFYWECTRCDHSDRALLKRTPILEACPLCGAVQDFVDESTSRAVEERDNGLMHRKVEQVSGIRDLLESRLTSDQDSPMI